MGLSRNVTARELAGLSDGAADPSAQVEFVSPKEAAQMTSLSTRQIDRLVEAGKFPQPVPLTERRLGFIKAEVLGWNAQRVAAVRSAGAPG